MAPMEIQEYARRVAAEVQEYARRVAAEAAMNRTPDDTSSESSESPSSGFWSTVSSDDSNRTQLHLSRPFNEQPVSPPPIPGVHVDDTEFPSLAVPTVRFVPRILPINWARVVIDKGL